MESQIKGFYKNKTVFITGGSGFLGRVVIEKLLRSTEVSRIYVLVRPKRGKSTQDRIGEWKNDPLFALVLESQPNALERVVAISGDCKDPDLGISLTDRKFLTKEVEVVLHCAATVNFTEPLHVALDINTRATRLMMQLAKEMSRLAAFVHVSTAFSNCVIHHITERFYPGHLSCSVDKVLTMRELCDNELIDRVASALLDKFPNTYTYTKALAEQLVQTESEDLPICIFRPGSIVATSREPVSGWIDNMYGPIAVLYGAGIGVLRIAPIDSKALTHIVPVDCCANILIASAWQTAKEFTERAPQKTAPPPTIYNYVAHPKNPLTNGEFTDAVLKRRNALPLEQSLWYPFIHLTSFYWVFKLVAIFYHLLPGYMIDLVLRFRGQKPYMIKLYKRIHKNMHVIAHFGTGSWTFETDNTDRLWQSLSVPDKQLFEFDMRKLNWDGYFTRAFIGMRLYLAKEDPSEESFKRATLHMNTLRRRHRLLQVVLLCGLAFAVKCLLGLFI